MTTYVAFGDSIIAYGQIPATVATLTGMTATNVGIGGTGIGLSGGSTNHDRIAGYSLVDAIVSNQWSVPVAAAGVLAGDGQCVDADEAIARLQAVDFSTVDIVTISYGTNDFTRNLAIGSNSDTQPTTFKGAVNYTLKKLMTACPLTRVMLTTPIWRGWWVGAPHNSDTTPNGIGKYLINYADALIDIGLQNHIPVADLYRNSGINQFNAPTLLKPDLTHPSIVGDRQLGFAFASALLSRFPMPLPAQGGTPGVIIPTLVNGWTKWAAGYEQYVPKATLLDGVVTLSGFTRPGSKRDAGTVLFNLPSGYRPPINRFFSVSSTGAGSTMQVQVLSSGAVRLGGGMRGDYIVLDGITYRTT